MSGIASKISRVLPPDRKIFANALTAHFDAETIAKGHLYQMHWRVWSCAAVWMPPNSWSVKSKVQGSRPESYLAELELEYKAGGLRIQGQCSCSKGAKCKHLAATVQHLMENPQLLPADRRPAPYLGGPDVELRPKKTARAASTDSAPPVSAPAPPAPSSGAKLAPLAKPNPKMVSWLQRLDELAGHAKQAASVPPMAEPGKTAGQLLFVLKSAAGKINVEIVAARPRLDGSYAVVSPCALPELLQSGAHRHPFAQDGDVALVRKLALTQPVFSMNTLCIDGAEGAKLLTEMLATQRCFWLGVATDRPPLSLGPVRQGRPVWNDAPNGRQTASFEITPAASILLQAPLWYVDERAGVCGPLDTGLRGEIASAWIAAPALQATDAPAIGVKLGEKLAALGLPKPRLIEFEEIAGVIPVPILQLSTTSVPIRRFARYYGYGGPNPDDPEELSFAHLEFDYAGIRVQPQMPGDSLREFSDGRMRVLRRDLKAEKKANCARYRVDTLGARA